MGTLVRLPVLPALVAVLAVLGAASRQRMKYYTPIAVGDSIDVHVQYRDDHKAVRFYLCASQEGHCDTTLWIHGATPAGEMRFDGLGGCVGTATGGLGCSDVREGNSTGWEFFTPGPIDFVAERRASEIAVWLKGHPEHPATALAAEGPRGLGVIPWFPYYEMPVQFGDNRSDSSAGAKP